MRPPATAYVTQMPMPSTPSQPICGTGRGNFPTVNISCSQTMTELKASAMLVQQLKKEVVLRRLDPVDLALNHTATNVMIKVSMEST